MKNKHTQGEWIIKEVDSSKDNGLVYCRIGSAVDDKGIAFAGVYGNTNYAVVSEDEARANAKLIAEAGTVANETGYTPRQLAEQKADLLEAMYKLRDIARNGGENGTGQAIEPEMFEILTSDPIKKATS